ncbi:MAG: hypothetical protein KJ613_01300 [Nanoarchaeota archaeon]|nr:hypothetical protein [Nanoarchaeota archaeon]MBU1135592.1 hypothetical protein [Nanoarchaeota archaeon]
MMRGLIYTLEAVIAAILIVTFLVTISHQFQIINPSPENMDEKAYNILKSLDDRDVLRNAAIANDFDGINNNITLYQYGHSIQICDYENTCIGTTPNASNVWVGTYIISGRYTYSPHLIRLYLW